MSEIRTIIIKHSTTPNSIPTNSQIEEGELAINIADKKIYTNSGTEIIRLGVTEQELIDALQNQNTALQNNIDQTLLLVPKKVYANNVTINTDTTFSIDLQTVFSTEELAELDPNGCNIVARVLDTDPDSPTVNSLIDATAVVTTGVSQNRYVIIHNHYEQNLNFYIRVDIPVK